VVELNLQSIRNHLATFSLVLSRYQVAEENSEQQVCEKCGTPLGRFAPAGVCARCLLEAGLSGSQTHEVREPMRVRLVKIFKRLRKWLRRGL
jgi:hypothetical protein